MRRCRMGANRQALTPRRVELSGRPCQMPEVVMGIGSDLVTMANRVAGASLTAS
jgi:hypothetical protein